MLSDSPEITEIHLIDESTTSGERGTILYRIDGDHSSFAERATSTPGIDSVAFSGTGRERTDASVVMRPLETPMFDAIRRASTRAGFVIRKPIIYRDGKMYARVVGDPEQLQRSFEDIPGEIDIQIDEIDRFRGGGDNPEMTPSDRHREVVEVALELGYYNQPRGATRENLAAKLGCAPPTASGHLQKAEAKLIHEVMDEFSPDV